MQGRGAVGFCPGTHKSTRILPNIQCPTRNIQFPSLDLTGPGADRKAECSSLDHWIWALVIGYSLSWDLEIHTYLPRSLLLTVGFDRQRIDLFEILGPTGLILQQEFCYLLIR